MHIIYNLISCLFKKIPDKVDQLTTESPPLNPVCKCKRQVVALCPSSLQVEHVGFFRQVALLCPVNPHFEHVLALEPSDETCPASFCLYKAQKDSL
jgi:hypothetical protein